MEIFPKLIEYIHKAEKAGMTEQEIIDKLLSVGHSHEIIHHHIKHYHKRKRKRKITNFAIIILLFVFLFLTCLMINNPKNNINEKNISETTILSTSSTSSVTMTSISSTTTSLKNITMQDLTSNNDSELFMSKIDDVFIRIINGKKSNNSYIINNGGKLIYLKGLNVKSIILNYEIPLCNGKLLGFDEVSKIFEITSFSGTFKYELNGGINMFNLGYVSECNAPLTIKSIEVESQ